MDSDKCRRPVTVVTRSFCQTLLPGQARFYMGALARAASRAAQATTGFRSLRQGNPFLDDPGHFSDYLSAKKHFVNIAHVEHIDDTAKIRLATIPPRIMGINHEVMLHVDFFMLPQLFQLHPVK